MKSTYKKSEIDGKKKQTKERYLSQKEQIKEEETSPSSGAEMASQQKRGRKIVKKSRARCYKRLNKLEK